MIHKQKIMAVGAHADDLEAIAGGTLAKYHDQGYEIVYVMTTNNMSGGNSIIHEDGTREVIKEAPADMEKLRKSECDAATALLGTKPIHLDYPQRHYNGADGEKKPVYFGCEKPDYLPDNIPTILTAYEMPECKQQIIDLILEHNPACIITLGLATQNIEHYATSVMVTNSFWSAVEQGFHGALIHGREDYTSFGEINQKWDTYIDISDYLDKKMELLGKHKCQMPTADAPDHGHRLRPLKWGVCCGCKAAEVFTWVRRYDVPNLDTTKEYYSPLIAELNQNTK